MSAPVVLLVLRALSAFALLAFLGGTVWFLIKEMRVTAEALDSHDRTYGTILLQQPGIEVDEQFALRSVTSIGRAATNNVIIDNNFTSAQHALVTRRGGQWWVEDLNSRNGTHVNDILLTEPLVISSGDAITIGDVTLKLEI